MCGIIGTFKEDTKRVIDMYVHWRRKGEDGVGILALKDNEAKIRKFPMDPVNMVMNHGKEIKELNENSDMLVYHTRYATIGKVDENGIHPFEGERYIVFHNGTVDRHSLIPKNKKWEYKAESDTEKIAAFLNDERNQDHLLHTLQKLVDLVHTIGVLIIYDKKENLFYLYRDHIRELVLVSEEFKSNGLDDVNYITAFTNSLKLTKRFYSEDKLFMVHPYSVIEIDSKGFIYDVYDLKAPKIIYAFYTN